MFHVFEFGGTSEYQSLLSASLRRKKKKEGGVRDLIRLTPSGKSLKFGVCFRKCSSPID